jgi:hypothetical protein
MEIPVYEMILSEDAVGHKMLSLVDKPAMLINWVKFNESPQPNVKFKIENEEQRIIFGPVLIPNLPVYRNENGKEYFLKISPETILQYAIKLSKDGKQNLFDVQHNQEAIDGVTMFEQVVTSKERFPFAVGFEDLPIGTMFAASKIDNDQLWSRIKSGELAGYSIDAIFDDFKRVESLDEAEVDREIKEILTNK